MIKSIITALTITVVSYITINAQERSIFYKDIKLTLNTLTPPCRQIKPIFMIGLKGDYKKKLNNPG